MIIIKKSWVIEIVVILLSGLSLYWVTSHDARLYHQDLGKIISVKTGPKQVVKDEYNNQDYQVKQRLKIRLLNGTKRGQEMVVTNTYSGSKAFD